MKIERILERIHWVFLNVVYSSSCNQLFAYVIEKNPTKGKMTI